MIITVTMNPAIDKTYDIDKFEQGGLNRVTGFTVDAGGKGINVSKTIKGLGGGSIAVGFLGGSAGNCMEGMLKELGIPSDFVSIAGETRTNLKIVEKNGSVTEINEQGPVVTEEERRRLEEKLLQYAGKGTLFVFAGSIPNGIKKDIYKNLIEKVKERGSDVFLDADGELFARGLEAGPTMIKPNRVEMEEYFHLNKQASDEDLIRFGSRFFDKGVKIIAISMGERGALFLKQDENFRCKGLKVKAHSTVGAGDAMVAALSYGLDQNMDFCDCMKLSMAASAGAVTTVGTKPPSKDLVNQLKQQVEMIRLYSVADKKQNGNL